MTPTNLEVFAIVGPSGGGTLLYLVKTYENIRYFKGGIISEKVNIVDPIII